MELSRRSICAGDFASGLSDGESTGRTGRCNLARREASGAAENFGRRNPSPGDFCREVAIVRARFGFALVAQLDRASDFEAATRFLRRH
jgi:hypothetical protein